MRKERRSNVAAYLTPTEVERAEQLGMGRPSVGLRWALYRCTQAPANLDELEDGATGELPQLRPTK